MSALPPAIAASRAPLGGERRARGFQSRAARLTLFPMQSVVLFGRAPESDGSVPITLNLDSCQAAIAGDQRVHLILSPINATPGRASIGHIND